MKRSRFSLDYCASTWNWVRHNILYRLVQILAFSIYRLPIVRHISKKWFWGDNGAIILLYHEIDAKSFDKHVRYVKSRCRITSLDDLVGHIEKGCGLQNSAVITFDDGLKSNFNLLPIIKQHSIRHNIPDIWHSWNPKRVLVVDS